MAGAPSSASRLHGRAALAKTRTKRRYSSRHAGRQQIPATAPDFDHILRANLQRVFNERDDTTREGAVAELFVADPVMYEPDTIVTGRAAISATAGALLERFGPDFTFAAVAPAVGHHGTGALRWQAGPTGGPITVTGTDVAEIVDGRIARLWVLIDPPAA